MEYGIIDILKLIGSLGLFIYGMKIMSEGLQKAAGEGLRKILRTMTSTRFSGILTGVTVTSLVQSSSATTVMVVSFVNAGLLTLSESMGVIMGANIGTTTTAWIISLIGWKAHITTFAIIMIGLFFPLLFLKKDRYKSIAEFVIGFGILFIGLNFLKESVPAISADSPILEYLLPLSDGGIMSILFFVLIGTLLTIIIQSSSATMAVTLVMMDQGWLPLPMAAAMVLGENIGTTITANLAAIVGNVHAKRAARFHFIFNVVGVVWMLFIMGPYLKGVEFVGTEFRDFFAGMVTKMKGDAAVDSKIVLSLFHTSFNLLNVLLIVWFVPLLEKVVIRMVPSKGDEDEEYRLKYISGGVMSTAELSLAEARKELQLFGSLIEKMSFGISALLFDNPKNPDKVVDKIKRREEITDNLEIEMVNYLTKVGEGDVSRTTTQRIHSMLSMSNDLERVADLYYQMARNYQRMQKLDIKLPTDALKELEELMEMVFQAIKLVRKNIDTDPDKVEIQSAYDLEEQINNRTKRLVKAHYKRLEKNVYSPQAGVIYLDYVNRAEKIGDHLMNVNEALVGLK